MKKSFLLFFFCMLLLANFLYAQPNLSGKKIYVDPGHGSYGFNDRPQSTIPYPFRYSYTYANGKTDHIPDTTGFFETNTNLWKCLYLGEKLQKYGATVSYSHTKAGPNPYPYINGTTLDWNRYKADPNYKTYYREPRNIREDIGANYNDYDFFISVHSNAPNTDNYGDDELSNYPMILYRGYNRGDYEKAEDNPKNKNTASFSPYNPQSYEMAKAAWRHCYELIEGVGSLRHPAGEEASVDNMLIYGDRDYYNYNEASFNDTVYQTINGVKYSGWLGVTCHNVPGFLSEGYHHSYGPARHRALNKDYCKMEGLAYFRGILDYFGLEGESVGYILGVIKDNNTLALDHKDYRYHPDSHDQWMPCDGAVVVLKQGDKEIKRYTVDNNYNGIFAFFELEPGVYTLESTYKGLCFYEQDVEVKANETTYSRMYPKPVVPAICAYDLKVRDNDNSYTFTFNANASATNAKIVFYSESGQKLDEKSIPVVVGANEVTLSDSEIPGVNGQDISWKIDLTSEAIANFALLHSDASLDIHETSQLFNAVNTNPMSDKFGHIYVLHRGGRKDKEDGAVDNGLWEYDYSLTKQNAQVYKGGSPFGHPTRMSIDSEGYLYISDWSDAQSGIYVANTANLTLPFTQFFAGDRITDTAPKGRFSNGGVLTGSSTPANFIYGEGKDTKLYVYDEDVVGNGVAIYNIGQKDGTVLHKWSVEPNKTIKQTGNTKEGNSALWVTSRGVFVSQHREHYDEFTVLEFYDNEGNRTYSSPTEETTDSASALIHGIYGAGFAVSPNETMLIVNDGKFHQRFLVFDIKWSDNTPTLELRETYYHGLGAIRQMNWDYAGNLICSGDDGIHIFSVPTDNNHTVIPARETIKCRVALEPVSRRIWAYDLKRTLTPNGYVLSFTSTVATPRAQLVLKNSNGETIKTMLLSNVQQGNNEFLLGYNEVPTTTGDVSWEITLSAGEVAEQATLQELTSALDKFYYYLPQDVKVNNNPASDHFGKIYVLETYDGKNNGKSQHSKTQTAGIYVYDQNLNLENYAKGYLPQGVDISTYEGGHQYRVLHRLAIDPLTNQVAFIQSKTDELWLADPNNLNKRADNILSGKSTYASSMCYSPDGTLYIFGYESTNATTKAIIYKKQPNSSNLEQLAEIDPWQYENERNSMAADGRGGLWVISQISGTDWGHFFHVNQNGDVDFNISTNGTTLTGKLLKTDMPENMPIIFNRGQLAYDAERNILAIGGDSKVTLYKVTYSPTTPTLEYWTSTSTIGNIDGIAFDYAGDLYVMSAATERFYKFAVPTDNNTCTTPAPESQKLWANPLILDDTKDNTNLLQANISKSRNVYVFRSLVGGMYNTLCLPFDVTLAGSCLEGATVLEYSHSKDLDGDILLYFDAVTDMKAGVPYLVEPQADIDMPMDFMGVQITKTDEEIAGEPDDNDISFNGILAPKTLEANDKSILFLVSGNRLAWANADADMYGMRGYFSLPEGKYDKLRTRARIVTSESTTTDIQQTTTTSTNAQKLILNGMLYILKDGQLYTVFGTKVK